MVANDKGGPFKINNDTFTIFVEMEMKSHQLINILNERIMKNLQKGISTETNIEDYYINAVVF